MRRFMMIVMSAGITASAAAPALLRTEAAGDVVQMEYLDRGTVAVRTDGGIYLSWRLLGTEAYDTAFDIYRDGEKIATVSDSTNYTDTSEGATYTVVVSGEPVSSGDTVTVNNEQYFEIPLDVPEGGVSLDGEEYTYPPNDVTPADVDGDGEYELILKWEPSNSFDSGKDAKHNGNVYIDCYEMSGEKLWRIDMGININAGAHFTQMAAYDFDLDGKAELAFKTAPGTIDGTGKYVSEASLIDEIKETDNSADYRHSEYGIDDTGGRVMSGAEFYTVFQGDTGAALDTIYYPHPRDDGYWGDTWGNRSERYLAGVAYLDGENPSMIAWRGYYEKTTVTAYNLEDKRLVEVADFDTDDGDNYVYAGNGNHNLTVGDVDGDGCDELISGSLALDNDLTVLWCSGRGHGDALHLADYDPTHDGMEYFSVHEEHDSGRVISGSTNGNDGKTIDGGMTLYDAETGEELFHVGANGDTGRGMMANTEYSDGYFEFWGSGNYISYGGSDIQNGNFTYTPSSTNFRIFWNGDLYDDLLDGASRDNGNIQITSRNRIITTMENTAANNDTKNNPCLQADLFGDWREEVVARSADNSSLLVYTTVIPTEHKLYTLMHDRTYRMQVACQNAGYNQPPHIGYYVNDDNSGEDAREYAAYIKTVHDGETSVRTENIPDASATPKPTPTVTAPPLKTQTPDPGDYVILDGLFFAYNGTDGDVIIPSEKDGNIVTTIIRGAFDSKKEVVETVVIPSTVTDVQREMFKDCVNLNSVVLSSSLDTIEASVFENCISLVQVIMPDELKEISYRAFAGCTSLETLVIPASVTSIDDTAFDGCTNLTLYVTGGSYAEEYAKKHGIPYVSEGSVETVPPESEAPSGSPTPEPSTRPTPIETPTIAVPEQTMAVTPDVTVPAATPGTTSAVSTEPIPTEPVPSEPALPYEIMDCTVKDSTVEVTIRRSSETDTANLIFASYDEDGRLLSIEMADVPDAAEFKKVFEYTGGCFKIYIWDINTLYPFVDVYENI